MPELSEPKQIISRLQKTLDEELILIKEFKNSCMKDQEWEKCYSARDIEKQVLVFRESLGS